MSTSAHNPQVRAIGLLMRATALAMVRERLFVVPVLLMALLSLFTLMAGTLGVESPAAGTFILNLGLSAAFFTGHGLTLLLAARIWPDDIERRTLYPLLARPVSRARLLVGRWLACAVAGTVTTAALLALAWLTAPRPEPCVSTLLIQQFALLPFSLGLLSAFAMALSLAVPRGVAVLAGILLLFAGPYPGRIAGSLPAAPWLRGALEGITLYLPDFSRLNLITRYTDGMGPLGALEWLNLVIYAAALAALPLLLAMRRMERRAF